MKCFVVCPIGNKNSETRRNYDNVLNHLIIPACKEFEVIRADRLQVSGKITSDILDFLEKSDVVIADVSENNMNVYFEVGYRLATHKPLVLIRNVNSENKTAFDIIDLRYCEYSTDVAEIESSISTLSSFVENTIENYKNGNDLQSGLRYGFKKQGDLGWVLDLGD